MACDDENPLFNPIRNEDWENPIKEKSKGRIFTALSKHFSKYSDLLRQEQSLNHISKEMMEKDI
jgi:hypothetical protein